MKATPAGHCEERLVTKQSRNWIAALLTVARDDVEKS